MIRQVHGQGLTAVLLLLVLLSNALADQLYLRDGAILEGQILRAAGTEYAFRVKDGAGLTRVPKQAVKFVLYDDPARAYRALDLDKTRHLFSTKDKSTISILPAKAFGEKALKAVRGAKRSIKISVYYLSGSRTFPVGEFYRELRRKAEVSLDVTIICEFGPGTSLSLKSATMEFAQKLASSGIHVLYMQDRRVLHKKLIIIDEQTVLLGSSNLTWAGMSRNNELNIMFRDKTAVAAALDDFNKMKQKAKPRADLKF